MRKVQWTPAELEFLTIDERQELIDLDEYEDYCDTIDEDNRIAEINEQLDIEREQQTAWDSAWD